MSSRKAPTRKNGDVTKRGGGPWSLVAVVVVCSAMLWAVVGCATDDAAGDARVAPATAAAPQNGTAVDMAIATPVSPSVEHAATTSEVAPTRLNAAANDSTGGESARAQASDNAMTASDFPVPPDRDLWTLAKQMRWNGAEPAVTAGSPTDDWQVGDLRDFWTLDYPRRTMVSNQFRLLEISDSAYWWTAAGAASDDDGLSRTVDEAEGRVFPRVESVFASSDEPTRVHIVNGLIPGVGGYVSGGDQYPSSVSPFSNEVPAIYINTRAAAYGDERFLDILAHELQHSIHQVADESEATWLNEGLSELAVKEAGYRVGSVYQYLRRPDASVVNWPADLSENVGLNYGAAALFAHYLREHHAPTGGLQDLLAIQDDGILAIDEFLTQRGTVTERGEPAEFRSVFADWMVANLLDEESGLHGYRDLDVQASITRTQDADEEGRAESLAQYGIDYVQVRDAEDETTIHFEGWGTTPLLPTDVDGECWWSNRGDSISATLTRELTVPSAAPDGSETALTYRYWHDIEKEWDYLYVSVSVDGGETWDVLRATGTTDANPVGNSYGYGYTGDSNGWQDGEASLAAYGGRDALVRFHYVTDDAINGPGMCVKNMRVSWDSDAGGAEDWAADGFVLVNNRVRQDWIVWAIVDGSEPWAKRMALNWDGERDRYVGSVGVDELSVGRLVVAVAPMAPATMQPGTYRVWVEAAK